MYFLVACVLGIVINDYEPIYDRGSENFVYSQYEWGGVGRTYSNRWLTMISPSYFVSCKHWFPLTQESVDFIVDGKRQQYMVDSFKVVMMTPNSRGELFESDLMIGRLTEETDLPYYSIVDVPEDTAVIALGTPDRAGSNEIDRIYTYYRGYSSGGQIISTYTKVSSYTYNDLPGEFQFQPGDSGAPTFVDIDGELAVIGVHYWSTLGPVEFGHYCGDSYIPYYKEQIASIRIPGDLYYDNVVDSKDLDYLRSNWGVYGSVELDIIREEWGRTGPGLVIDTVPEPQILALLFFCIFILFARPTKVKK